MAKGKTAKKIVLKSAQIIDGQNHRPGLDTNIRSIDEIMGVNTSSPFKAKSLAEFEKLIDEDMNLADMQAMATRIGLLPVHDRVVLKKRLLDEFKKDRQKKISYDISNAVGQTENLKESTSDKARKILNEGR